MKYLTYNKFGKRMGRLGNSMFQLASLWAMAKRFHRQLVLPEWNYQPYFEQQIQLCERGSFDKDINEYSYHFSGWAQWHDEMERRMNEDVVSISGWLQSSKYWEGQKGEILSLFNFKNEFRQQVGAKFSSVLNNGKQTIAISVRVGEDYKENGNYVILPINYYIGALYEYFPKWRENYNVIVFSDDFEYCKLNLDCSENIYFADELNDIEQLCLGTMCHHWILANSTFSWWMAYLGEKYGSKVIRPAHFFKGYLLQVSDIKDFWEPHWQVYDHEGKKFNLTDVEFHIPVTIDHKDRLENYTLVTKYLNENFDTNIVTLENSIISEWGLISDSIKTNFREFHRTRFLNDLATSSPSPYIVNFDADNICPPLQILIAVDMLRKGQAEMVYPYDGRCARVGRDKWYQKILAETDCGIFKGEVFRGTRSCDPSSVGHMIFWNKEAFIRFGMENEHFISYGPEDVERYERAQKLGININRVKGPTYHIDHWCGPDSSGKNPHFANNYDELERIRRMSNTELEEEVASWPWVSKYTEAYYGEISESATESFREIIKLLSSLSVVVDNVLDIGCGVGEAGVAFLEAGFNYKGVDFRIPKHKLLINPSLYTEFDLRYSRTRQFPLEEKFDMVVCTEVLEHIEPEYADGCIGLLCRKADLILFSAAIPFQGGLQHYNEQWQDFWAEKFAKRGFYPVHIMYNELRNNKQIDLWYRNNLVMYKKDSSLADRKVERYIHPDLYTNIIGTLTNWMDSNKKKQTGF